MALKKKKSVLIVELYARSHFYCLCQEYILLFVWNRIGVIGLDVMHFLKALRSHVFN